METKKETHLRKLLRRRYRYRQVIGVVFLVTLVGVANPAQPTLAAGIGLVLLGAAVRLWASGHIHKDSALAITGPYAFVRHPLYLGNCLLATGFCLAAGQPWAIAVWATILWLFYIPAMKREDEKLHKRFGREWEEWRSTTPAIIPFHWPGFERGLRKANWSISQSLHNGEPVWTLLMLAGIALTYARLI